MAELDGVVSVRAVGGWFDAGHSGERWFRAGHLPCVVSRALLSRVCPWPAVLCSGRLGATRAAAGVARAGVPAGLVT
jgi:hypothetical protein